MYPLFDLAIRPVLKSVGASRLVEIGALRGETTARLIDDLGPATELHVIDPLPEFDPTVHEAQFPGQYIFHRHLSLDVLDGLPPMDAALIDGDHNWYTVYNELRMLTDVARRAGRAMPVMILHDVGWPYDRRDLYYDPSNIPEEHRRPHARRGINRRTNDLAAGDGGFNKTLHNAVEYGGPRNGVMTAVDDFLADHDRPTRRVVLPIYFGLAILAEESVLDAHPELRTLLDHLESATGKAQLLELAEEIRLDAANLEQNFIAEYQRRLGVLARRHLATIRHAVLDTLNPEQELRIQHLLQAGDAGTGPDALTLADPVRAMRPEAEALLARRRAGGRPDQPGDHGPRTTTGEVGAERLEHWLDEIMLERIPGDLVDCGTGRGGAAILMRAHLDAHFVDGTTVRVIDRFSTSTPGDLNTVRDAFHRFGLLDDRVRFQVGSPLDALAGDPVDQIAMLRVDEIDTDEIDPVLRRLYPSLAPGGRIVVMTHDDPSRRAAVDRAVRDLDPGASVECPDHLTTTWRKVATVESPSPRDDAPPATAPHPPARLSSTVALSVVVVFYDMLREAGRTLRSLSRSYQQGIDDLDYEVIVIDNGSPTGRSLDREFVESFGPEFRLIDLAGRATASPTTALNLGIAESRGDVVGVMIDGAHVLSPGVFRHALTGMTAYAPAVVATQGWYLGPGQQSEVMAGGYDQAAEDRLVDAIEWPTDGYRLFDIAHFQADRDWFDGMWESNCLFVSRATLDQVGGFDDSFSEAGGGYANLELFERVCTAPDVNLVTLLGEASFHQVHGGTTNNQPSPDERFGRIESYADRYRELRGRPFGGPRKLIHYVGTINTTTRRTKSRRMAGRNFFPLAAPGDPDGLPLEPSPMPESLGFEYLDAYWRSLGWRETRWLGTPIEESADDLVVFQQLIHDDRPEWIIDTTTGDRARSLYLASICDLLDHGRVLSISTGDGPPVDHPRVTNLAAPRLDDRDLLDAVRSHVPERSAMVVLGSPRRKPFVMAGFDALAPFVAVGGHAVIEWTAVNGNPLWAAHGPGPTEALKILRTRHTDFIEDPTVEAAGPSFHRGGYLKRVR